MRIFSFKKFIKLKIKTNNYASKVFVFTKYLRFLLNFNLMELLLVRVASVQTVSTI